MSAPEGRVRSVDTAAQLLLLFGREPVVRVGAAARHLGVAPSTAHRLLSTLAARGLVERDPVAHVYYPGPALVGLGLALAAHRDVRVVGRERLRVLRDTVGETVHLVVLDVASIVVLETFEPLRAVSGVSVAGHRSPAHLNAAGKVLLAALDPGELLRLLPGERLPGATARSIRRRAVLLDELAAVRTAGFAVTLGELEEGLAAVAAPVVDGAGRVRAAVSVSGSAPRLAGVVLAAAAARVREVAAAIGSDL